MVQIVLTADKKRVSVAPGAGTQAVINIENLSTLLDQVTLSVEGVDPGWVQFVQTTVPVFGQGTASTRALIHPPRDAAQALAGVYPLRVRGASQERTGEMAETALELEIQLIGGYRLTLERDQAGGSQEARYILRVQNDANAPLVIHLTGADEANALLYKFEPFELSVGAGQAAAGALTVRARRPALDAMSVPFTVTARGEYTLQGDGRVTAPAQQLAAQFTQGAAPKPELKVRLTDAGLRRAQYVVTLRNPSPAPMAVTLSATDAQNLLRFTWEGAQVALGAGETRSTRLVVTSEDDMSAQRPFRVLAQPAAGQGQPVIEEVLFAPALPAPSQPQPRPFPWWIIAAALAILALVLIVAILLLIR